MKQRLAIKIFARNFYRNAILLGALLSLAGLAVVSLKKPVTWEQGQSTNAAQKPGTPPQASPRVETLQKFSQPNEAAELRGSSARRVYVDPITGRIGTPPPGAKRDPQLLTPEEQNALSSSAADLVETRLGGPAGGIKVDLQGRFRSESVVSINTQSNVSVRCVTSDTSQKNESPKK